MSNKVNANGVEITPENDELSRAAMKVYNAAYDNETYTRLTRRMGNNTELKNRLIDECLHVSGDPYFPSTGVCWNSDEKAYIETFRQEVQ